MNKRLFMDEVDPKYAILHKMIKCKHINQTKFIGWNFNIKIALWMDDVFHKCNWLDVDTIGCVELCSWTTIKTQIWLVTMGELEWHGWTLTTWSKLKTQEWNWPEVLN